MCRVGGVGRQGWAQLMHCRQQFSDKSCRHAKQPPLMEPRIPTWTVGVLGDSGKNSKRVSASVLFRTSRGARSHSVRSNPKKR